MAALKKAYEVMIVGAGPVGLCTGIELARRGIDCLLIEKGDGTNDHPRANVVNPRSMEHFRRWGIAEQVIDAGLPRNHKTDVIFTTRLFGKELARFAFPSIDECRAQDSALLAAYPDVAASPYFKTAVGQNHLESVLRAHARSLQHLSLELGLEAVAMAQDDQGASVLLSHTQDGASETVSARYVVACDGAKSFVRSALGVQMEGEPTLGQNVGIYFRAPGLIERSGLGDGILYWTLAPGASGVFIAIDGKEEWVLQRHLVAGESPSDFDAAAAVRQSLGSDFPFEIVTVQPWVPRQLVASTYRVGRVLLAGDAAHLLSPTGGFGMNTGIGDAVDVAWKLAATLRGWGGVHLIDSYEAERKPIAWRNAVEATDNRRHIDASAVPPQEIEDDSTQGEVLRGQWAERLRKQKKHFSAVGITLGYRYEGSPIVVPDGTSAPTSDPMLYVPTARPGSRAPHVWLGPGHSILDLFGDGFTLLRFGPEPPGAAGFVAAACAAGIPLVVRDIDSAIAAAAYVARLVLVRPDGHVAWRSDVMPAKPAEVLQVVTGAVRTEVAMA